MAVQGSRVERTQPVGQHLRHAADAYTRPKPYCFMGAAAADVAQERSVCLRVKARTLMQPIRRS